MKSYYNYYAKDPHPTFLEILVFSYIGYYLYTLSSLEMNFLIVKRNLSSLILNNKHDIKKRKFQNYTVFVLQGVKHSYQ